MQKIIDLVMSILFLDIPLKISDTTTLHYNLFTIIIVFFVANCISFIIYRLTGSDNND